MIQNRWPSCWPHDLRIVISLVLPVPPPPRSWTRHIPFRILHGRRSARSGSGRSARTRASSAGPDRPHPERLFRGRLPRRMISPLAAQRRSGTRATSSATSSKAQKHFQVDRPIGSCRRGTVGFLADGRPIERTSPPMRLRLRGWTRHHDLDDPVRYRVAPHLRGWRSARGGLENMETGAAFWHMVDLIWVLLYPLVYLLR